MADNKAVTIRTRKFMTNRLLSRKQFVSILTDLCLVYEKYKIKMPELDDQRPITIESLFDIAKLNFFFSSLFSGKGL